MHREKFQRTNLEMSTAVSAKDKVRRQLENKLKEVQRDLNDKERSNVEHI
jgi:hypothetical protein